MLLSDMTEVILSNHNSANRNRLVPHQQNLNELILSSDDISYVNKWAETFDPSGILVITSTAIIKESIDNTDHIFDKYYLNRLDAPRMVEFEQELGNNPSLREQYTSFVGAQLSNPTKEVLTDILARATK